MRITSFALEVEQDQNHKGKACYRIARKIVPSKQGRIPVRVKTHDKHPGQYRHGYRKDENEQGG